MAALKASAVLRSTALSVRPTVSYDSNWPNVPNMMPNIAL